MVDWERIMAGYKHKTTGALIGHHPAFRDLPDEQLNAMLNDFLAISKGQL